jgi:DNA polymerase phi
MMLDDIESSQNAILHRTKESATEGQDGFVEILLSFLGNPRALFHKIATEAFAMFASEITREGLQSLTDILSTNETLEGQQQLFAQEDEAVEEDDEEGSDSDMEEASDVEMVDSGSNAEDSDEGSSGDGQGDSEDDNEEDEELTNFNRMLALTLQTSKATADGEADEETSDDSDMDDDQMMALDPHLSNIFKQRSQITGKKERTDAKKNMIQFKSRVLDLLAIFLDKGFSNPLTLDALLPVVRLTRASANKQLSDKSAKLLKTTFETHTKQKTTLPKPDHTELVMLILKSIHEEAKRGGGAIVHAQACSSASLHLVRVLVGLEKENYAIVTDVYADSQKQWFMESKSEMQSVLFSQFLNWSTQFRSSKG